MFFNNDIYNSPRNLKKNMMVSPPEPICFGDLQKSYILSFSFSDEIGDTKPTKELKKPEQKAITPASPGEKSQEEKPREECGKGDICRVSIIICCALSAIPCSCILSTTWLIQKKFKHSKAKYVAYGVIVFSLIVTGVVVYLLVTQLSAANKDRKYLKN